MIKASRIVVIAIILMIAACHTMEVPRMINTDEGRKLDPSSTQEVDQEELDLYIAELMESQGWEKPDNKAGEKISDRWILMMTWTAGATVFFLAAWVLTHLREAGGVAMVTGCSSIISAGLASMNFWIVGVVVVLFVGAIVAGFVLKDWHIMPSKRKSKKKAVENV